MSQVTCSLCNMKIDEIKWQELLVSTNNLQNCGRIHNELTTKLFRMILGKEPELQEIYKRENQKNTRFPAAMFFKESTKGEIRYIM